MKNLLKKIYNEKVLCILFLLFPIVELITSITVINTFSKITLGSIYKTFIVIYGIIYILIINNKKRLLYNVLLGIVIVLTVMSFIVTTDVYTLDNLLRKIPDVLKFITFRIITIFYICYVKNGNKMPSNAISLSIIAYAVVMLIASWSGTANPTYGNIIYGHTGWYYSANELGILFGIAFPFIIAYVIKSKSVASIIACGLCVYGLLSVGTKAGFLSLIITIFLLAVFCLVLVVLRKWNLVKWTSLVLLIIVLGFAIVFPLSPANNHLKEQYINKFSRMGKQFENFIYSGREEQLERQSNLFLKSSLQEKLFGLKDSSKIISLKFN